MKAGEWFKSGGMDLRWLLKSPVGRVARCDRGFSHVVQADQPRLQVDSQTGPVRKRGKGKRHEYLCTACAWSGFQTKPPSGMDDDQMRLF